MYMYIIYNYIYIYNYNAVGSLLLKHAVSDEAVLSRHTVVGGICILLP